MHSHVHGHRKDPMKFAICCFPPATALLQFVIAVFFSCSHLQADLVFTIDTYTENELTFSISGTFESDTTGNLPGFLAIKNDWSRNVGIHTEMFSQEPVVTANTLTIGGLAIPSIGVQNSASSFNDSIFIFNPVGGSTAPFLAGTVVAGSLTLEGPNVFSPTVNDSLELVSGFVNSNFDWARLEASAVPEPSTITFLSLVATGILAPRRRRNGT